MKPRIAVVGTGGTMQVVGRDPLDVFEYWEHEPRRMDAAELVALVPELDAVAEVCPVTFERGPSQEVGPQTWLALHRLLTRLAASERLDGIVITHGTAVLEETAYFLNLTLKLDLPVVLVAAQRPPTGLSSDTPLALLNAVRAAADPRCRGLGVLAVVHDEIHAAREVTKSSTLRVNVFSSGAAGILGTVDPDGSLVLYRAPARRRAPDTPFDVAAVTELPRVDILYSYAGEDAALVVAAVGAGARGLVSAGFAPGLPSPTALQALLEARQRGVLVVQSCRVPNGRVLRRALMRREGLVAADDLSPQKARILAMLALTLTDDAERVQALFDEF